MVGSSTETTSRGFRILSIAAIVASMPDFIFVIRIFIFHFFKFQFSIGSIRAKEIPAPGLKHTARKCGQLLCLCIYRFDRLLNIGCTSRELFEILFVRSAVYASLPRPPQLLHPCLRPPWQVHHLKHHHHDHHLPILGLGKRLMYIPTYLCNQANVLAGYS